MTYYSGMIAPVPTANRQAYIDHVTEVWPIFQRHGATRMVETWGVDIQKGKVNDLMGAVQAKPDEAVVFTWIEWPDRATCDAAWPALESDPEAEKMMQMPFDGKRMIFGGFEPVLSEGEHPRVAYYQGFALAVPDKNKPAYAKMAADVWPYFQKYGCLGIVEGWGVDVPHGKTTDFYRATKAEDGEVPMFSWTAWPDRATCDAASQAMMADMDGKEMPEMPFDGMRMMWGGFETIFDSKS